MPAERLYSSLVTVASAEHRAIHCPSITSLWSVGGEYFDHLHMIELVYVCACVLYLTVSVKGYIRYFTPVPLTIEYLQLTTIARLLSAWTTCYSDKVHISLQGEGQTDSSISLSPSPRRRLQIRKKMTPATINTTASVAKIVATTMTAGSVRSGQFCWALTIPREAPHSITQSAAPSNIIPRNLSH